MADNTKPFFWQVSTFWQASDIPLDHHLQLICCSFMHIYHKNKCHCHDCVLKFEACQKVEASDILQALKLLTSLKNLASLKLVIRFKPLTSLKLLASLNLLASLKLQNTVMTMTFR
jgi:hypothetical protein